MTSAAPREQHQAWAREARALEEEVRALIRTCPPAAEEICTAKAGVQRRYDAGLIPAALAVLAEHDPAAARTADGLMQQVTALRWQMVEELTSFIRVRAGQYAGTAGLELEDAIQVGTLGAFKGAARWDPDQGPTLTGYCSWWIQAAITRSMAEEQRPVRLPSDLVERVRQARKLRAVTPDITDAELADEVGCSTRRLQAGLAAWRVGSLDEPLRSDESNGATLGDRMAHPDSPDEETLTETLDAEMLGAAWPQLAESAGLDERSRRAVELRFGLGGGEPMPYREVGDALGCSREFARQLLESALGRLRRRAHFYGLTGTIDPEPIPTPALIPTPTLIKEDRPVDAPAQCCATTCTNLTGGRSPICKRCRARLYELGLSLRGRKPLPDNPDSLLYTTLRDLPADAVADLAKRWVAGRELEALWTALREDGTDPATVARQILSGDEVEPAPSEPASPDASVHVLRAVPNEEPDGDESGVDDLLAQAVALEARAAELRAQARRALAAAALAALPSPDEMLPLAVWRALDSSSSVAVQALLAEAVGAVRARLESCRGDLCAA